MATFIEYQLDDHSSILIESSSSEDEGITQASRGGDTIKKATKTFREALVDVKTSAKIFVEEMSDMNINEMEITFGVTGTGELSNFAVGKVGVEANYQVTLKWKQPSTEKE